jgi:hypothetical protein
MIFLRIIISLQAIGFGHDLFQEPVSTSWDHALELRNAPGEIIC